MSARHVQYLNRGVYIASFDDTQARGLCNCYMVYCQNMSYEMLV